MTCERVRALLPLYPEADNLQQDTVREHLAQCSACRSEFEEFEEVRRQIAAAPEFAPEVYAALTSRVHARIRRRRRSHWLWAAAAGLLLASGLGLRPAKVAELHLEVKAPAAPAIVAGFRKPGVSRKAPRLKPPPVEPMEIRIVGDDSSVLIVWQVGDLPPGGGDE